MQSILIHPDGKVEAINPKNKKDFKLKELQTYVGGFVEIVYTADPKIILVVNEEGKIKGMKPNLKATQLLPKRQGFVSDILVGPVVLCDASKVK